MSNKSSIGMLLSVAAIGAGAWLLLRKKQKYGIGDRLRIEGVHVVYTVDDIFTVDKIKWYVLNDGSGQFRVEIEVVDRSPMWKKI